MNKLTHKINLKNAFDEYGFSEDYYEFLDKYSDEIMSETISQECLDKMVGIIIGMREDIEADIITHIYFIYVSIISIKYMPTKECGPLDCGMIYQFVESSNYLNNHIYYRSFKQSTIDELCGRAFEQMNNSDSVYYDIISKIGFIDEFKLSKIIYIDDYLNSFKEIGIRENDEHFLKVLNKFYEQ